MLHVYGLKNCDTCRAARNWLADQGIAHDFIDIRGGTVDAATVASWAKAAGVATLLNRRGTTWRGLGDADKAAAETDAGAIQLMAAHPALIKRPVWVSGKKVLVGFDDAVKAALRP